MKSGNLIVFTGIDGSGKTTQAKYFVDMYKLRGVNVVYAWCRWEPLLLRPFLKKWRTSTVSNGILADMGYSVSMGKKKKLLANTLFRSLWLAYFYIEYSVQVFFRVTVKLLLNNVVISDRLYYDSIIDQAVNCGINSDELISHLKSSFIKISFPQPDHVFYIDCPEDIALKRKQDSPGIDYLRERRFFYLKLAKVFNWHLLDGTLPIEKIHSIIRKHIDGFIK